ncbi:MAG: ATP-binding cassette domain-containing protein, partial [Microcystaceae cyanobacterium]
MEILRMAAVSVTDANGFENLLDSISFTLNRGDRLGIMGPSGAGKTTLLRLLNRLIEPSQGTIFFEEKSFLEWPVIALRRQIVLVPQEPKLLGMKVQESLAYPLKLQSLSSQEIQSRIHQICDRLQIPDDWLERNELQLSL